MGTGLKLQAQHVPGWGPTSKTPSRSLCLRLRNRGEMPACWVQPGHWAASAGDHSLSRHQAQKPVLTALTNVCLEAFLSQTEKGSMPESVNSEMCLSVLLMPSQGESHRARAGPQRDTSRARGISAQHPSPAPEGSGHPAGHQQPGSIRPTAAGPQDWAQAGWTPHRKGQRAGRCPTARGRCSETR